jgi:hypothetical protein
VTPVRYSLSCSLFVRGICAWHEFEAVVTFRSTSASILPAIIGVATESEFAVSCLADGMNLSRLAGDRVSENHDVDD